MPYEDKPIGMFRAILVVGLDLLESMKTTFAIPEFDLKAFPVCAVPKFEHSRGIVLKVRALKCKL